MPLPTKDRFDPVEPSYRAIERYEIGVDVLAWLAVVAFAAYVGLYLVHSSLASYAKLTFVMLAVAATGASYWFRFMLQPVADRQRRRLLIKDGIGIPLTAMQQAQYWNNGEQPSCRRLLMNLAENTFFVSRLLRAELGAQVFLVLVFTAGLVVSVRFGTAEVIELFAVLLVFSEILLGKLVRLTWTLTRSRQLHLDAVAALRDSTADEQTTFAYALYVLGEYEYIKGRAGYRAGDRTFKRLNPMLTARWDAHRKSVLRQPLK